MILFLIALLIAALAVGLFADYNPAVHDIALRGYRFTGVPGWQPIAAVAGVVLVLFLAQAGYGAVRIKTLRSANARLRRQLDASAAEAREAPKSETAPAKAPLQPSR
jgi:hypothetical protein